MMTSKEIAEMIQRAKEAEALFDDLRDDERPVYSTLQKVGSALDELIQFAESPVYDPVKTEDLIPGLYWVVDEFGGTSVGLVWQYANERFYRAHSIDTDYGFNNGELKNVTDLFKFYRIPQLNLEVSK